MLNNNQVKIINRDFLEFKFVILLSRTEKYKIGEMKNNLIQALS